MLGLYTFSYDQHGLLILRVPSILPTRTVAIATNNNANFNIIHCFPIIERSSAYKGRTILTLQAPVL